MTSRTFRRFIILFIALAFAACCTVTALAEDYTAANMRLTHYEGTVEIEDENGEPRFVMENVRFASGEAIRTGEDGKASISLDDSKIVSMDSNSRVEFTKKSDSILLVLTEGELFLDVQEKLDENESLDIQTSNMTVGIRGTIVFLSEDPEKSASQLGVLEGTAQVSYKDENGISRVIPVPAGNLAVLTGSETQGAAPVVEELKEESLSAFVANRVESDPAVMERVRNALDLPGAEPDQKAYAADGDWTWDSPVTLVAQSASKLYDGQPLMRPADILVYGLPADFTIQVAASGSMTDAGETENPIGSYAIYNAEGENVTRHFTNVEKVSGNLVVDPAPLTVWTGSAEKVYDGEPLTEPEAGLRSYPGYEKDIPNWRNLSYVVTESAREEILYGLSGVIWVHGTNPLTGETQEIELFAGQKLTVFLHNEDGVESIEFQITSVSETELPEDILRLYAENPDLLAQAIADTGWDAELLQQLIDELIEKDRELVESDSLQVESDAKDRLMRDCTNVRITIDTDITSYDNRSLGEEEAHYTPVTIDESIVVTATGSQTEVGESVNTYEIDWGNANPNNYILSEELGTLTVHPAEEKSIDDPVTLSSASADKVYDGEPLSDSTVTAEGLPEGYSVDAAATGSQTAAGSSENTIESYKILDADGADVTDRFTNVTVQPGTLTVEALQLSCDLGGTTAVYDGALIVPDVVVTYANGAHAGETVSYVETSAATASAAATMDAVPVLTRTYTLFTGDQLVLTVTCDGMDAGTHTLTGSCSFPAGTEGNFDLSFFSVEYTVEPAELTITTESAEKAYDGTPLTAGASVSGLIGGETVTVTATGSITDVGTTENTYEIDWGGTNPDNYTVTENIGTLTVTKYGAVFDLGGFTSEYNGDIQLPNCPSSSDAALEEYHEILGEGEISLGVEATFTLPGGQLVLACYGFEDAGSYTIAPETTFLSGSADNYDISYTNAAMTITPMELNIRLHDGSSITYNGEEQTGRFSAGNSLFDDIGYQIGSERGIVWGSDEIKVFVSGGGTDAGDYTLSSTYSFASGDPNNYHINVTNTSISIVPAPLTIVTDSAEKVFDGTPLTSGAVTVTGLVSGETATVTPTGAITDAGTASNTCVITWGTAKESNYTVTKTLGTLKVTELPLEMLTNGTYTYDGQKHYGELTVTGADCTTERLADNKWKVTLPWDDVFEATLSVSGGPDAGTYASAPSLVSCTSGSSDNYSLLLTGGIVTIDKASLTVTTGSASKEYDGTPLTKDEASITGLKNGETAAVAATGTITDIDTTPNTYSITWGTAKESNYEIDEQLGTLEIKKHTVTVTIGDISKTYDGTPLTGAGEITADGLLPGYNIAYAGGFITGSQTDAGSSTITYDANAIGITDSSFAAADDLFNVVVVPGTRTVKPLKVTFNMGGKTVTYWGGHTLPNDPTGTYEGGGNVEWISSGGDIEGVSKWIKYSLTGGGQVQLTYSSYTDAGTYTITPTVTYPAGSAGNYTLAWTNNTMTISKRPLTVTTGSASKEYDGTPLTCAEATITNLVAGETATAVGTGSITHRGSTGTASNTYTINWGTAKESNYYVETENLGTLTLTRLTVRFSLGGGTVTYDGNFHGATPYVVSSSNPNYTFGPSSSGDGKWTMKFSWGDDMDLTPKGGGTEVGTYTLSASFSIWASIVSDYDWDYDSPKLYIVEPDYTTPEP